MLEQPMTRAEKDEGQKEKSNKAHLKEGAVLKLCATGDMSYLIVVLLLESIW